MNKIKYIIFPIIILLYLSINLYLIQIGSSLCQTNGCQTTKTVLSINSEYLYYIGIIGAFTLLISGYLSSKIEIFKRIFETILFSMIIGETILVSYLYLKTNEFCILCLIFYGLLILNYLSLGRYKKILLSIIVIIGSMFILDIKEQPNKITEKYTIIGSEDCKYCIETKEELSNLGLTYKEENYKNYKEMFKALQINTIPVLIIKNGEEFKTIVGKNNIINEFNAIKLKNIEINKFLEPIPQFGDIEGCNLNLLYEKECEE